VIGAAIDVHRDLGPGFSESVYETTWCVELAKRGIAFERRKELKVTYRIQTVGTHRPALLIERVGGGELKAVTELKPIFYATVRSCPKAADCELGLLLNYSSTNVAIKRVARENYGSRENSSYSFGVLN